MAEIATENKAPSSGKKLKVWLIVLAAVLIVGGVVLFLKIKSDRDEALRQSIIGSGTFHPGITVAGVDISGMTPDEAAEALKGAEQSLVQDVSFRITDGEHIYAFDQPHFDIAFDTEAILAEAMALGREGDLDSLQAALADIAENGRSFDLSYTAVPRDAESFVAEMAAELDTPATDATFSVKQLELNEDTEALDVVNIGFTEEELAAGADLRDKRFDFTEGTEGRSLDQGALVAVIRERAEAREYGEITFELQPLYPSVTVATLKQSLVLRSSAWTSYAKGNYGRATRVHNMTKACGLIYGTVLQPGDVLSCNDLLGPRYEKYGWQMAPAVIEGGAATEDQPGGGVCQIATTAYMAVLYGDFEVTARRPHSTPSGYPNGLDATINTVTGYIDFKWKNNTESPCYVFTWIDTKNYTVNCSIYGQPFPETFDEIELSSTLVEPLEPGEPEYEVKSSLYSPYWMLKNKAVKGSIYESFKTYKLKGKVVETKSIGNTEYKMHPTRYYVWPGYAGEPLDPQYELKANEDGTLGLANPGAAASGTVEGAGTGGTGLAQ